MCDDMRFKTSFFFFFFQWRREGNYLEATMRGKEKTSALHAQWSRGMETKEPSFERAERESVAFLLRTDLMH